MSVDGAPPTPPVLLIAWRRPATARAVLDAVRIAQPSRLFVAVDGPDEAARPGERAAVAETIATIAAGIDWPCEVQHRYAPSNLGCRRGVSSAIDWFFSEVEAGVILEDDCVPSPQFFTYCAELLERYRDDPRVLCISGDNSASVLPRGGRSYAFVRYPQIWGWATWRRAWQLYDRDLERYAAARVHGRWERAVPDPLQRKVFERRLDRLIESGEPDTWDFQWVATVLLDGGYSIHPRANLVRNVGFDADATHTTDPDDPRADAAVADILPLRHPRRVRLHRSVNQSLFLATQVTASSRRANTTIRRWRKRLLRTRVVDGITRRLRLAATAHRQ